jgi:16S rRNA processing protein RimM
VIGLVAGPFGLRGEMKTRALTDDLRRFEPTSGISLVLPDGRALDGEIERSRPHKSHVLVKMRGIDSVEEAEAWRGAEVRAKGGNARLLPDGTFYVGDMIGMRVVTLGGRVVGVADDVVSSPGHDLLKVGDVLIPMVRAIVTRVDTEAREIVVDPPVGLLPEDGAGH